MREVPVNDKPAVVLLSGGLDSSTTLAIAKSLGFRLCALTLRYGQKHGFEVQSAHRVADRIGVAQHRILEIDLGQFGGSALTGDLEVPHGRSADEMEVGIPVTYVPARNTIFLSLALAWAEVLDARDIFIGVNAVDYSGYPDCRPEFIESFERLANLATRVGLEGDRPLRIRAPLILLSKAEIIRRGLALGVDFSLTHSCYGPDLAGRACGTCDACLLRLRGFEECGIEDPLSYQKK